jgi:hypothetical protein
MGAYAMRQLLGLLLMLVMVTSCVSGGDRSQTLATAAAPSLDFVNLGSFDRTMSAALRDRPQTVTVNLLVPTTVHDIPERLGTWLTMVDQYSGTIELQRDPEYPATRGFEFGVLTQAASLLVRAYKLIEHKLLYGPVREYNATIYYKEQGMISKVVLTHKETIPGSSLRKESHTP